MSDFEFIEASEVEMVRRGRQSSIDPNLIANLAKLTKGKAIVIKSMKLDPTAKGYKNEKNRVSATIRSACKQANLDKYSVRWSPTGVPQVVV